MLSRPSSRPGTTTSDGRGCDAIPRSAAAMARRSRPCSSLSIRTSPSCSARDARIVCSSRGRRLGTMIAGLSKVRISQKVLYPPIATTPGRVRAMRFSNACVEGDRLDSIEPRDPHAELLPAPRPHEGPEDDQGGMRQPRIRLVGADDPVDEVFAVAAAAGGHEDERLGQGGRGRQPGRAAGRHALQVAGVGHLLANRRRESLGRRAVRTPAAGRRRECRRTASRAPISRSCGPTLRRAGRRIVQHVAQAQHEAGTLRP